MVSIVRHALAPVVCVCLISGATADDIPFPCTIDIVQMGVGTANLKVFEYSLQRMGTMFRIVLYAADPDKAGKAAMAAFERLEELEDILSIHREESELSRVCRTAAQAPQIVSSELFFVLENSLRISKLTGGAFDVTVGPLIDLWRTARQTKRLPSDSHLKKALRSVGYTNVELDPRTRSVFFRLPNIKLDLGGIGKGYAADQALSVLRSRGVDSALIDAGGDITLSAAPPGKAGWKIEVRDPDQKSQKPREYVVLYDAAVATSGDAHQYVEISGRRYSHIINPINGLGVTDSASVTVIARDGMTADALATALSIMSPADGIRLAESIEGASALIVRRTQGGLRRHTSRNFPKMTSNHIRARVSKHHDEYESSAPMREALGGEASRRSCPRLGDSTKTEETTLKNRLSRACAHPTSETEGFFTGTDAPVNQARAAPLISGCAGYRSQEPE